MVIFTIYLFSINNPIYSQADIFNFMMNVTANTTALSVNMPEYFRNVPRHEDDGGGISGPILKDKYDIIESLGLGFCYLHVNKSGFAFGGDFLIVLDNGDFDNNLQERNYTNAIGTNKRGYGAALTFCQTKIVGPVTSLANVTPWGGGASLIPGLIMRVPFKYGSHTKLSIGISYQALAALNGWDRYDKLEVKDHIILAHLFPLGVGINFNQGKFFSFELGTRVLLHMETAKGKEFNVKFPTTPGLYASLIANFDLSDFGE